MAVNAELKESIRAFLIDRIARWEGVGTFLLGPLDDAARFFNWDFEDLIKGFRFTYPIAMWISDVLADLFLDKDDRSVYVEIQKIATERIGEAYIRCRNPKELFDFICTVLDTGFPLSKKGCRLLSKVGKPAPSVVIKLETVNAVADKAVEKALMRSRGNFFVLFRSLVGKDFADFETKHRVARAIQETMDKLRLAFVCPTCGLPAKLRCRKPGRSKTGQFQFEHFLDGRTVNHGGGNVLSELKLVTLDGIPLDATKFSPQYGTPSKPPDGTHGTVRREEDDETHE